MNSKKYQTKSTDNWPAGRKYIQHILQRANFTNVEEHLKVKGKGPETLAGKCEV